MFSLTRDDLAALWRNADPEWLSSFAEHYDEWCERWDVTTPQRLQHFLAQVSAETAGLRADGKNGAPREGMVENFGYTAKRIEEVFSYRLGLAAKSHPQFKGKSKSAISAVLAKNRTLFAEVVYGNRKELGNTNSGDGGKFIGRGPLQCTGRYTYNLVSQALGIDCVADPTLLEHPDIGWQAAFIEWHHSGCNQLADGGSVEAVSRRVNGGTNGLAERVAWHKRIVAWWPDDADIEVARAAETMTFEDVASASRKAVVVAGMARAGVGVAGTTATVKVASEVLPEPAAPPPADVMGSTLEQLSTARDASGAAAAIGRSVRELAVMLNANGLVILLLASIAVVVGAWLLKRWMVEDVRAGRYMPSGRGAAVDPGVGEALTPPQDGGAR